ncbi:hypothetical protein LUZ60_006592 [Juncus effusus]|nr:hypothetical protein LUZ60_006592 [Juncus effusus]
MEEVKNEKRKKALMETENRIEEARLRRARHLAEKAERANVLKCILKKEADRANSYGFSQDFASKYELLDRIGTGTYGTVFKARVKDIPHAPLVAVKAIVKALMNTPAKVAAVKKEALILEILSGKTNMLKFYGAYEDSDHVYFVMELCEGRDLYQIWKSRCGIFTENEAICLIEEVLKAVQVCHANGIVHRDLKFENFIFSNVSPRFRNMKLIDFGLSEFLHPGERLDTIAGTYGHIAPEIFDGLGGMESDSWTVGVLAYVLLVRKYPFPNPISGLPSDFDCWRPDFSQGPNFSDRTWRFVPPAARHFVMALLHPDPRLRLSLHQALGHEWIARGVAGPSLLHYRASHSP